jgi:hypothetical protein
LFLLFLVISGCHAERGNQGSRGKEKPEKGLVDKAGISCRIYKAGLVNGSARIYDAEPLASGWAD